MFRWLTAGESHGRALVAICEGVPSGVEITTEDLGTALARRRAGYGRGARMSFEQDEVELTAGVRHGRTLGGPVAIRIANTEWPKWEAVMSADPVDPGSLEGMARNAPLTRPRPGHADLAGMQKFGHTDARPVLERASARETAARVALGEVARRLLSQVLGIEILSHVVAIGATKPPDDLMPGPEDKATIDADPVRCADPATSQAMVAEIDAVKQGRRHPGRRRRGAGLRAAARAGQLHPLGPAARRPAGRGADVHPGHQGRRGRGRLHHGDAPRLTSTRRDRSHRKRNSDGVPTGRAASRAA